MQDSTPVTLQDLCGYNEGDEVIGADGQPTGEIVVADLDGSGNVIGWHKEAKA